MRKQPFVTFFHSSAHPSNHPSVHTSMRPSFLLIRPAALSLYLCISVSLYSICLILLFIYSPLGAMSRATVTQTSPYSSTVIQTVVVLYEYTCMYRCLSCVLCLLTVACRVVVYCRAIWYTSNVLDTSSLSPHSHPLLPPSPPRITKAAFSS